MNSRMQYRRVLRGMTAVITGDAGKAHPTILPASSKPLSILGGVRVQNRRAVESTRRSANSQESPSTINVTIKTWRVEPVCTASMSPILTSRFLGRGRERRV